MSSLRARSPQMVLAALLFATGCGLGDKLGDGIDIVGTLKVDGDEPAAYSFKLYSYTDNQDAFDTSYCSDGGGGDCYGRVITSKLDTPVTQDDGSPLEVTVSGGDITISGAPLDLAYVLVATGDDGAVACSTDVLGYDEDTKVVTSESAITLASAITDATVDLPRTVRLSCAAPSTVEETPEEVDEEPPVEDGGDIPAGDDPVAAWVSYTITDKSGSPVYGDASAASVEADVTCGASFPSVLQVHGTAVNTSATEAYIRIQFGSGDSATYRTIATPIVDGEIDQAISLTGGYAVVQLDLDETLDGVNESYTISFCDREEPPAQEMLTILTWDKDDTDVDTHIYSGTEEVAYYSLSQSWGDLDIDDVDGFGPETFTTKTSTWGNLYGVRVHYYSDHGNGDTLATMRVIYYDDTTGKMCDITASQSMSSYDWWEVGTFGPGSCE